MSWIALTDTETQHFIAKGLDAPTDSPDLIGPREDDLMTRGTLLIETRMPNSARPRTLIHYDRGGDWPFHISLQAIPGGGLILILNQGGSVLHQAINPSEAGRMDIIRLSYSWDAPSRWARLALEQTDQEQVLMMQLPPPCPLRAGDARALFKHGPHRFVAPDVVYMALSTRVEPVGPMPSLLPDTPIATPRGYRPLRDLRRGDTVIASNGEVVPVLHRLSRTVPAIGSTRPMHIRAPYFGLLRDIRVAPAQRLVLSGSEVEYLFGQESVLCPAAHLTGGHSVRPIAHTGLTVTYSQLLLPARETILAAGTVAESLSIGRLRRKPHHLAASVLSGLDRHGLPDHGKSTYPVLRPFDAKILAERRVA